MDSSDRDLRDDSVIALARARPFRLGGVEVRPATREIVGAQGRDILEPRVMQVLVALARADGEIVTRDDLIASCWEGRIVGEDAITRVISRLRRHSEGVGRDGWTLETVTKVGYRLSPASTTPAQAAAPIPPAPRRRTLLLAGGGLAVAVAVTGGAAWRLRKPPVSPEARVLYDKGREALRQELDESTAQAVGFLRQAVAEQPDYAAAWGALSRAYQMNLTFTEPSRQAGVETQARAAAKRALELEANQPDATATLALLAPVYRHWASAEPLYLRALRLHPKEPSVEYGYSRLVFGLGRIKAALVAAEAAAAGDPYAPRYRFAVAITLWSVGRTEEAELVLRKALALWPRYYALWFLRLNLLAFTGRPDQALAFGADLDARPTSVPAADLELSLTSARALQTRTPADVEAAVRGNLAAARRGVGFAEGAMRWLCGLGRVDEAFAVARGLYLDEGFSLGAQRYSLAQDRFMRAHERNTDQLFMPATAPMRADPRFGALMRDIGIAAYWQATKIGPDNPAWAVAAAR